MNLTDLQKELRSMEERLSVLQKEIEGMKPKTAEEKKDLVPEYMTITPAANRNIHYLTA